MLIDVGATICKGLSHEIWTKFLNDVTVDAPRLMRWVSWRKLLPSRMEWCWASVPVLCGRVHVVVLRSFEWEVAELVRYGGRFGQRQCGQTLRNSE